MRIFTLIIGFFTLLLAYSCSSDFEVTTDWSAIPVVYCILDQSQTTQYVKVTKAFLGDAPASVMAQISDSLFYEDVEVRLYEKTTSGRNLIAVFEPTEDMPRDSGYFASDRNTIYKSEVALNSNKEYFLEVQINDIGKTVTNELPVKLIENCYISVPSSEASFINFSNYNNAFNYEYYSGVNGKVYQMILKFNYLEVRGGDTTENAISVLWPQPMRIDSLPNSPNDVKGTFSIAAFYNLIKESIPTEPNVIRLVKMPESLEFQLVGADDNYYTYMQISQPASGLAQSKPLFTNLTNGVGLFAARYNTTMIKMLGDRTLDSLSEGIYTFDKGFVYHTDSYYMQFK